MVLHSSLISIFAKSYKIDYNKSVFYNFIMHQLVSRTIQVIGVSAVLVLMNFAHALTIETVNLMEVKSVPVWWEANRTSPITADADVHLNIINIVNDYLWFWLAAVCLWVLVYAGIRLMTAQWDQAVMQQTNKTLVGMLIGLTIALLSYTIIRMVANLF